MDPQLQPPVAAARMPVPAPPSIVGFDELSRTDTAIAGGKGANLGELLAAGLPVPAGFVITAGAYLDAMQAGDAREPLRTGSLQVDPDDAAALAASAETLRALVLGAGMPPALRQRILDAYHRLGDGASVAIRSSATMEDTAGASFAGMNESFTNVRGDEELIERVQRCWMSMFGQRVLAYRASQRISDEPAIAVVVQKMVVADRAGVLFTANPSSADGSRIIVEAAFGLGEVVVGGQVEPDTYVLAKDAPRVLDVRIGRKTHKIVRGAERQGCPGRARRGRPHPAGASPTPSSCACASSPCEIERHYGTPQDVEWALRGRGRCRSSSPAPSPPGRGRPPRARASCSSPASAPRPAERAGGCASCARSQTAIVLQSGEVLVAAMTSPDWVPILRRAAALVTDQGGMTCHAAIVSRELRLPVRGRHRRRDDHAHRRPAHHRRRRTRSGLRRPRRPGQHGGACAGAGAGARARRRSAPASTSTWRWPIRPRPWPRCRSTAWASCARSSCITDALGGVHPKKLVAERRSRATSSSRMAEALLRITPRLRTAAGHLSDVRLSHQRVPRARRAATSSSPPKRTR